MQQLTGAHVAATVKVLEAADVALEEWLEDEGLRYDDLPLKHRQMLERIVVAVMLNRDAANNVVTALTMPEPKGLPVPPVRLSGEGVTHPVCVIRGKLLERVANLKSTNKTERGLPNEISHDTGWQGALDLMQEAIEEICK